MESFFLKNHQRLVHCCILIRSTCCDNQNSWWLNHQPTCTPRAFCSRRLYYLVSCIWGSRTLSSELTAICGGPTQPQPLALLLGKEVVVAAPPPSAQLAPHALLRSNATAIDSGAPDPMAIDHRTKSHKAGTSNGLSNRGICSMNNRWGHRHKWGFLCLCFWVRRCTF